MPAYVSSGSADPPQPWPLVLCLVGLDYFSSLAYLPSIAVEAAGAWAPLAVGVVVLATFLLALPVYMYVVGVSSQGRGASALLERLVAGWRGKILVLTLLGFAAADFVVTRSLSVADAAVHLINNPHGQDLFDQLAPAADVVRTTPGETIAKGLAPLWNRQIVITLGLSLLTFLFFSLLQRGFARKMIVLAVAVVGVYLLLSGFVIASGLAYLAQHPELVTRWWNSVSTPAPGADGWRIAGGWLLLALWSFPQLALGLSGFELTMTVAPMIKARPRGAVDVAQIRARNTRKMMLVAASTMAVYLLGAVLVTTLLVPPAALEASGLARHRALAYLAHGDALADGTSGEMLGPLFGQRFGNVYDASTVVILCLAGASVMAGLRRLVPHYLHRLGMELSWAGRVGMMTHLLNAVILLITVVFRASLSSQQWAYATSVLVLLTGASLAATLDVRQRLASAPRRWLLLAPFAAACLFFAAMTLWIVVLNQSGLAIASAFVLTILVTSFISRWLRSTELRFEGFSFANESSRERWDALCSLESQVLVPHRPGLMPLADKHKQLQLDHRLPADVAVLFVEVTLGDPSDFYHVPRMRIVHEEGMEVIRVSDCVSVAHVIAAMCVEFCRVGNPPEVLFGWSNEPPLAANLNFLLLGEGNVPWMVKSLVHRAIPNPLQQPRIRIG